MWPTVDPHAENYYSISPYAYCAGNPVKFIDPNGMDWFVNNNTGEVYYQKKLTTIDDKYAKDNGLGSADSWERLGDDAMFDSKDMKYSSNVETIYMAEKPAERFMNDHKYEKAERVSILEESMQSWEPRESGVGRVTYNHYEPLKQTSKSKITYVRPDQLDKKTNFKKREQKFEYNMFETVRSDLIKPFGQSNNKTAYYQGNVQSDNINTGLNAVSLFFDLLKLFRK